MIVVAAVIEGVNGGPVFFEVVVDVVVNLGEGVYSEMPAGDAALIGDHDYQKARGFGAADGMLYAGEKYELGD